MILYGPDISPFVARVRIALAAKGLETERRAVPEGGYRGEAYLAINPVGKVPALVSDGGDAIAESETIVQFIDETYPEPPLLPTDPAQRAAMRTIGRVCDNYLNPALLRLYHLHQAPSRDEAAIAAGRAEIAGTLTLLDRLVSAGPGVGERASFADCMLLSSLLLADMIAPGIGGDNLIVDSANLVAYLAVARRHAVMGPVYQDAIDALAAIRG